MCCRYLGRCPGRKQERRREHELDRLWRTGQRFNLDVPEWLWPLDMFTTRTTQSQPSRSFPFPLLVELSSQGRSHTTRRTLIPHLASIKPSCRSPAPPRHAAGQSLRPTPSQPPSLTSPLLPPVPPLLSIAHQHHDPPTIICSHVFFNHFHRPRSQLVGQHRHRTIIRTSCWHSGRRTWSGWVGWAGTFDPLALGAETTP
jgi:hypothetical protein